MEYLYVMFKHIGISFYIRGRILSAAELEISEAPLRHPILAYLTLARLNGLDDNRYREAVRATQK